MKKKNRTAMWPQIVSLFLRRPSYTFFSFKSLHYYIMWLLQSKSVHDRNCSGYFLGQSSCPFYSKFTIYNMVVSVKISAPIAFLGYFWDNPRVHFIQSLQYIIMAVKVTSVRRGTALRAGLCVLFVTVIEGNSLF